MKSSLVKSYGYVAQVSVYISLLPPVVMTFMMFHPIDALHTILEVAFELKVSFQPKFILIALTYGWASFAMCNTFITYICTIFLTSLTCIYWSQAIRPVANRSNSQYETQHLGVMSSDRILSIYREHQILCIYNNSFVAMFRVSLHFALLHSMFILCLYLIIKYFAMFVEKGAMELIGVLMMFVLIALGIVKIESILGGHVVESSVTLKKSLMMLTSRKTSEYKVAVSLQKLSVKTTYPLFSVSHETFLEFLNVSVDHIVNLLCLI